MVGRSGSEDEDEVEDGEQKPGSWNDGGEGDVVEA
jgi:hypothetical protein